MSQAKGRKMNHHHFEGTVAELDGHVFHVPRAGSNSFHFKKTLEKISQYVLDKYKYGVDMVYILTNLEEPDLERNQPTAGDDENMTEIDLIELRTKVKIYVKRLGNYDQNKSALFSIVRGQCSEAMLEKLHMCPNFFKYEKTNDVVALLKDIRSICYGFPPYQDNIYQIIRKVKRAYHNLYQFKSEPTYKYYERFLDIVDIMNYYGGDIGCDRGLIRDVAKRNGEKDWETIDFSHEKYAEFHLIARERMYAMDFLLTLDKDRFGALHVDLHNRYICGTDLYPKTLRDAYRIAMHYEPDANTNSEADGGGKVSSGSG
jgi:hypothetical protein